jgi:hypothetical protein
MNGIIDFFFRSSRIRWGKRAKYAIFGNCQTSVIREFIESSSGFSQRFERVDIPAIHEMTEGGFMSFLEGAHDLSLLIYQHVKRPGFSSRELLGAIRSDCTQVSIPSLFFNSYNPEVAYLRGSTSRLFYHDRLQMAVIEDYRAFAKSLMFDEDLYSSDFSYQCVELSFSEMMKRERENNVDVLMSDYIMERYKIERLFHVMNHPSQSLLRMLSSRILDKLRIRGNFASVVPGYDLDRWEFPIYFSHYQNCGFQFENPYRYVWDGVVVSLREFHAMQATYYASLSPHVLKGQRFSLEKPRLYGWDLAAEFAPEDGADTAL